MLPAKWPGFSGLKDSVKFCIPRGGMFSSGSALMKSKSGEICISVIFLSPKLNSCIDSCVSVSVKRFFSNNSGVCLRSICSEGDTNVEFADG